MPKENIQDLNIVIEITQASKKQLEKLDDFLSNNPGIIEWDYLEQVVPWRKTPTKVDTSLGSGTVLGWGGDEGFETVACGEVVVKLDSSITSFDPRDISEIKDTQTIDLSQPQKYRCSDCGKVTGYSGDLPDKCYYCKGMNIKVILNL